LPGIAKTKTTVKKLTRSDKTTEKVQEKKHLFDIVKWMPVSIGSSEASQLPANKHMGERSEPAAFS
jgi:hypothetical protein